MKLSIGLGLLLLSLGSCSNKQNTAITTNQKNNFIKEQDTLYTLTIDTSGNTVAITAPDRDFELPDSTAQLFPYKLADFNNDKKEDVLVYMGACGTGGCMYGLFLKQYADRYQLAFMDYLKNPEFEKDKNGQLLINSYEEAEAFNPSKLHVSVFKFDPKTYSYIPNTTYVYQNNSY